jgi:putative hydrolase
MAAPSINLDVARRLQQAADLLEQQGAMPPRAAAYRRAASAIAALGRSLGEIVAERGALGVSDDTGCGGSIAAAVDEMVRTGRWAFLERLRGETAPEKLFRSVPGVGPTLARRLHEDLHIDTLEELEAAAWDGRLDRVRGLGARKVQGLRDELAVRLGRVRDRVTAPAVFEPPVSFLLDVDREYRSRAARQDLKTIAPRRFNTDGEAWLPILHTQRGDWHFTALFSNTARAHQLGKTHDWVILYFYDGDHRERQRTIVTETHGDLGGRRVVRGREDECRAVVAA